jgi:hypothetical protein
MTSRRYVALAVVLLIATLTLFVSREIGLTILLLPMLACWSGGAARR